MFKELSRKNRPGSPAQHDVVDRIRSMSPSGRLMCGWCGGEILDGQDVSVADRGRMTLHRLPEDCTESPHYDRRIRRMDSAKGKGLRVARLESLRVALDVAAHWRSLKEAFGSESWTYGRYGNLENWVEAVTLGKALPGDRDAFEKLRGKIDARMRENLDFVPDARRSFRYADQGDRICVDRYLLGESECWKRAKKRPSRRRFLRLGIDPSGNCKRKDSEFQEVLAAAVAAIDILIERGYSVELLGMYHTSWGNRAAVTGLGDAGKLFYGDTVVTWPLYRYGERFNPGALLPWGSSATGRYLGFSLNRAAWPGRLFAASGQGHSGEGHPEEALLLLGLDGSFSLRDAAGGDSVVMKVTETIRTALEKREAWKL